MSTEACCPFIPVSQLMASASLSGMITTGMITTDSFWIHVCNMGQSLSIQLNAQHVSLRVQMLH